MTAGWFASNKQRLLNFYRENKWEKYIRKPTLINSKVRLWNCRPRVVERSAIFWMLKSFIDTGCAYNCAADPSQKVSQVEKLLLQRWRCGGQHE